MSPHADHKPPRRLSHAVSLVEHHGLVFEGPVTPDGGDAPVVPADGLPGGDRPPTGVLLVVDDGLAGSGPADRAAAVAAEWLRQRPEFAGAQPDTVVAPGGERCKNDPEVLQTLYRAMHDAGLCRRGLVVAVGGGAVLDVAGYAAATCHRGIGLVRVPTTTLAQADAAVGVKNGINLFGKKNFLGTFAVPRAVVIDASFLGTLPGRDWRAGFSEAVKVALLKDAALFDAVERDAGRIAARDLDAAWPVIRRSAELHFEHITVGGDPFERSTARPLDFGHWAAHRLESLTGFELSHGEAVAVGLGVDVRYAELAGLLDRATRDRALGVLRGLGFSLEHAALRDADAVMVGLEEFRQHLGGRLTVTLIGGVGRPVDVHEIDAAAMRAAIAAAARGE